MIGYKGLLFVLCLTAASYAYLPDGISGCSLSLRGNNFNQCVIDRLAKLAPHLRRGIPRLSVPPLDPFRLPSLAVNNNAVVFSIKANLKDIQVNNAMNYKIKKIHVDLNSLEFWIQAFIPQAQLSSAYAATGKLLFLDLTSVGVAQINLTGIAATVHGKARRVIDETGVQRFQLTTVDTTLDFDTLRVALKSPPQYASIAKSAQSLVNNSPKLVYGAMRKVVQDTISRIFIGYANTALRSVTEEELLLK